MPAVPVLEPQDVAAWCKGALQFEVSENRLSKEGLAELVEIVERLKVDGHIFSWLLATGQFIHTLGVKAIKGHMVANIRSRFFDTMPHARPGSSTLSYITSPAHAAVNVQVNLANEKSHPNWNVLKEMLTRINGSWQAVGVAASHSQTAREEVACKLINNHKFVIADATNPSPHLSVEGKMLTQTELERVDVNSKPHVDKMLREVARRLLGCQNDSEQIEERPDPMNIEEVRAWRVCAKYFARRTQYKHDQKLGRKPDMSQQAAAAFVDVLNELAREAEEHHSMGVSGLGQQANWPMHADNYQSPSMMPLQIGQGTAPVNLHGVDSNGIGGSWPVSTGGGTDTIYSPRMQSLQMSHPQSPRMLPALGNGFPSAHMNISDGHEIDGFYKSMTPGHEAMQQRYPGPCAKWQEGPVANGAHSPRIQQMHSGTSVLWQQGLDADAAYSPRMHKNNLGGAGIPWQQGQFMQHGPEFISQGPGFMPQFGG